MLMCFPNSKSSDATKKEDSKGDRDDGGDEEQEPKPKKRKLPNCRLCDDFRENYVFESMAGPPGYPFKGKLFKNYISFPVQCPTCGTGFKLRMQGNT